MITIFVVTVFQQKEQQASTINTITTNYYCCLHLLLSCCCQMNEFFLLVVGPIYLLLTAAAILSLISPALHTLSCHGKTRISSFNKYHYTDKNFFRRIWNFLLTSNVLTVKKSRFTDFYVVGIITTILLMIRWNSITIIETQLQHYWLPKCLLLIHLIRRLCECVWIQKSMSTSRMHVAGYLLGVLHYLCLPFVFIPAVPYHENKDYKVISVIFRFVSILGCLYYQYQQFRHHVILSKLRRPNEIPSSSGGNINSSYRIPTGGWFDLISCPHYLAEIMLYFMFAIMIQTQTKIIIQNNAMNGIVSMLCINRHWVVLLWVATNLSISASRTHAWYVSTFGLAYPKQRRKLIPYLW